jgi:hypothetical protein
MLAAISLSLRAWSQILTSSIVPFEATIEAGPEVVRAERTLAAS